MVEVYSRFVTSLNRFGTFTVVSMVLGTKAIDMVESCHEISIARAQRLWIEVASRKEEEETKKRPKARYRLWPWARDPSAAQGPIRLE